MWWSPDGNEARLLSLRREQGAGFLSARRTRRSVQDTLDVEAYPKPGVPNPVVDLFVYDVDTKKTTRVDVRDGKPFENDVVGHYVYRVAWSPDGKELLFNRTNRRQNMMELAACSPDDGQMPRGGARGMADRLDRELARHAVPRGRQALHLGVGAQRLQEFLSLRSQSGQADRAAHAADRFEVVEIVRVDEKARARCITSARDGDNYMKLQLHRVGLDGKNDVRLTDPAFTHSVSLSPDGKYFVDVAQTHDQAAGHAAVDANGKMRRGAREERPRRSSTQLGLKKVEMFTYQGRRRQDDSCTAMIHFPSNFDPSEEVSGAGERVRRAGVGSSTQRAFHAAERADRVRLPRAATLDSRATPGMGKQLPRRDLSEARPDRDGRHGRGREGALDRGRTSTRTASASSARRTAATRRRWRSCVIPRCSRPRRPSSPPTDWRNYDTIYTERYMWIPQENKDGLRQGSAMTYANNLQRPADALLRHGGQQRAPDELDAAHPGAAARRQELRGAGRAGPGPLGAQQPADDGVLHRESRAEPSEPKA